MGVTWRRREEGDVTKWRNSDAWYLEGVRCGGRYYCVIDLLTRVTRITAVSV